MSSRGLFPGSAARVTLWAGVTALLVRLLAMAQEAQSAFFGLAILDERYYQGAAWTLLGWSGGVALDGFRPLAYPAFLAVAYGLGGTDGGATVAIALQHLLGIATGVLVALTAWRWAESEAAGITAGVLWALAGPPVFFEGQLLAETLFTFLMAVQLWVVTGGEGMGRRALAGGLTGLLARVRPNGLLLGAAYLAAPLWERSRRAPRLAAVSVATLVAAYLAGSLVEMRWTGRWVPLAGSGGVNLYLGNERGADGLVPRQDAPVPAAERYVDSVDAWSRMEFLRDSRAPATPGAVSRYWVGRTVSEIRACPGCWLRLMGHKAVALVAGAEVPNHRSYVFTAREEVPLLRWLPVRWWFLVAVAPLGLIALVRVGRGRQAGWALAFAALHALGVVLFFVNSRYRLPLWPLACAWGGLGCHELVVRVRARDWRRLGTALATAFPLAAVSWSASALLTLPGEDRDHFYRSLARQQNGLLEGALGDARTAVAGDPRDPAYRVQLGNLLLALDRHAEAIRELVAAVRLDPRQPISHSNLGVALEESGDVAGARAAYGAALSQAPDYRPARENLALLELSEGRFEAAREALSGGPIAGEPSARGLAAAGLVALAAGECDAGEELLDRARALDREAVDAIVTRIGSRGHRPPGVC